METNCILIKNNVDNWKKLQDIWQETISYSGSSNKIEIILIRYHWKVWGLDRSWKSQVLQRTT